MQTWCPLSDSGCNFVVMEMTVDNEVKSHKQEHILNKEFLKNTLKKQTHSLDAIVQCRQK